MNLCCTQNVTLALTSLDALLKSLGDLVTKYNDSLMGVVTKPCNTSGDVTEECTAGQLYAGMLHGMYDVMNRCSSIVPICVVLAGHYHL